MPNLVLTRGLRYSYAGRLFKVNEPQDVADDLAQILLDIREFDGQGLSTPFALTANVKTVAEEVPAKPEPAAPKKIVIAGKASAPKVESSPAVAE